MRCLVLAPVFFLVACAGGVSARRPVVSEDSRLPAGRVTASAEALEAAARVSAREAGRLIASATSRRSLRVGPFGAPSRTALLIVERAGQLVGLSRLSQVDRSVPDDCSGFVRVAYQKGGIDLVSHGFLAGENAVSAIFRRAQARGAVHQRRPRPGDLVFFRETYDRNRDGLRNDGMTHIGVVEGVGLDGTITFIHRGGRGVARSRMNLLFPRTHRVGQGGPVLNDFLRSAARGHRAYLTGELFVGFASPESL